MTAKTEEPMLPIGGGLLFGLTATHLYLEAYPPRGAARHVGFACATTSERPRGQTVTHPPSVAEAIQRLTLPVGFAASLPYVTYGDPFSAAAIVGSAAAGCIRGIRPPALIPVSGAAWECQCLRFNQPGVPMCSSGADCAAAALPGSPGPLPVYLSPSEAARQEYPTDGHCLLCIRADAEALDAVVSKVVESSVLQLGTAAVCPAPFQNLVDVADG